MKVLVAIVLLMLPATAFGAYQGNPDFRTSLDLGLGFSSIGSTLEGAAGKVDYGTYRTLAPSLGLKVPVAESLTLLFSGSYVNQRNDDLFMFTTDGVDFFTSPATLKNDGFTLGAGLRIYLGH